MPSFTFTAPDDGLPLRAALEETPSGAKEYLKKGFHVLAGLSADDRRVVLDAVCDVLPAGGIPDPASRLSGLQLKDADASLLVAAGSAMGVFLLYRKDLTAEEFVSTATEVGLVDRAEFDAILDVAKEIVSNRPGLRRAMDIADLGLEVLPSLRTALVTVDARVRVEDEAVILATPVAVVHMISDVPDQSMWFQVTKRQLEDLIKKLQVAGKKLDVAQKWIDEKRS